jgi:GNAT superfamily N-acetyltransferase
MNIKIIRHKDLQDFIESGDYHKSTNLPISYIRGLSQVKNPRALPDDLVIVMVFEHEALQGYLGVLPDNLYFENDKGEIKVEHAGWLSCIWVNPEMRGQGIASLLIDTVFKAWDYRILATEFTPVAKGLYDKSGQFEDLAKPEGIRAYMRLNLSYLLPAKNPQKWTKFKIFLKVIDTFSNALLNVRRFFFRKKKVYFKVVSDFDDDARNFIQQYRLKDEVMKRSIEDLEWILKNQWIKSNCVADALSKRYHFSSVANYFAFKIMKVYNAENQLRAVLMLSIREENLKIPYIYFCSESVFLVADAVEQFMIAEKLSMLTIFQTELAVAIKKNCSSFFLIRKMKRHYIISRKFEIEKKHPKPMIIQDGDADAAFT